MRRTKRRLGYSERRQGLFEIGLMLAHAELIGASCFERKCALAVGFAAGDERNVYRLVCTVTTK